MPAVNHLVLASGAVVVVSIAVSTAVAIYESPELRRYADDVRRRIAMALHSMGDGINPPHRPPRYNRPEDAEGFMQSGRGEGAQPGVDADEETRRRQREELLYWNTIRMSKMEQEKKDLSEKAEVTDGSQAIHSTHGSSFDDFLRPDASGESDAYVFNTGSEAYKQAEGLRHRGEGPRGFTTALSQNPFGDEHYVSADELEDVGASQIAPGKDEIMSDIYSATTRDQEERRTTTLEPSPVLVDLDDAPSQPISSVTLERELPEGEYMVAGQEDREEAYASIQAWAQDSSRDFYSPLPVTPTAPVSEPELLSDGQLTPTDSVSLIGSGEDIANDARSVAASEPGRPFDVMSESDGMLTPASWSEVGSVISDNEPHLHA